VVTLRAISGHRDTGPSECPGNGAYTLLPALAAHVAQTGLPKLYAPVAAGALGGPIRFQARLSSSLDWTVTVTDTSGKVVGRGGGRGTVVDWTWHSKGAGKAPFAWTIAAGPSLRAATGTLGGKPAVVVSPATPGVPAVPAAPTVLLSRVAATPVVVAPNPDGSGAVTTVSFALGAAAHVTASVADWNGGAPIGVFDGLLVAGRRSFPIAAGALPDGRYTLLVTATPSTGKPMSAQLELVVDRTLTRLAASPPSFSPNGDGVGDAAAISFTLARPVPVRIDVKRDAALVGAVFSALLPAGPQVWNWDGLVGGVRVPDGVYSLVVTVTDGLGDVSFAVAVTVDTTPPVLNLLDPAALRFQLSEPATLALVVNGRPLDYSAPQGTFTVPWTAEPVTSVSATARDTAGNLSASVRNP
jgi:hypothetical protein